MIKQIKKILNQKNKDQMTIVPLILVSSSQTHRASSLTSAWARLFQLRRLQKHQGEGRPRRPPAGRRARALPRLTGGVRLQVPASARRSRRRPAAGRLLPLGARLRGCRGGRSSIRAGGAGGSGAWTWLPAVPGSVSPRRLLPSFLRSSPRRLPCPPPAAPLKSPHIMDEYTKRRRASHRTTFRAGAVCACRRASVSATARDLPRMRTRAALRGDDD